MGVKQRVIYDERGDATEEAEVREDKKRKITGGESYVLIMAQQQNFS